MNEPPAKQRYMHNPHRNELSVKTGVRTNPPTYQRPSIAPKDWLLGVRAGYVVSANARESDEAQVRPHHRLENGVLKYRCPLSTNC